MNIIKRIQKAKQGREPVEFAAKSTWRRQVVEAAGAMAEQMRNR